MKKTSLLISSVIFCFTSVYAQNTIDFGIKAGINYNSNGELIAQADEFSEFFIDESTGRVGYNIGIWARKEMTSAPIYFNQKFNILLPKAHINNLIAKIIY